MTNLEIIEKKAYLKGTMENTVATDNFSIVLKEDKVEGVYESQVLHVSEFNRAVVSWNAHTSDGSSIEVMVRVGKSNSMSDWFSYGSWSKGQGKSAENQKDSLASLSIDEILVDGTADRIQIKVIFKRNSLDIIGPELFLLAVTFTGNDTKSFISDFQPIRLEVPMISQMLVPKIGNEICSPTSVTMLMNYHGDQVNEVDTAKMCLDHGADIYGNWSFNMAHAGERGYRAYVESCPSLGIVYDYLKQGIPVAASVWTPEDEPIPGAPQGYPSGHLLVIKGFEWVDGKAYVLVNDPASKTLDGVERLYPVDAFEKAWANIIYVLKPRG